YTISKKKSRSVEPNHRRRRTSSTPSHHRCTPLPSSHRVVLLPSSHRIALLSSLLSRHTLSHTVAPGRHLAELCRDEYPNWARLVVWFMADRGGPNRRRHTRDYRSCDCYSDYEPWGFASLGRSIDHCFRLVLTCLLIKTFHFRILIFML
ncbi:Metal transporter Nramp3, partial [Linum perenne]